MYHSATHFTLYTRSDRTLACSNCCSLALNSDWSGISRYFGLSALPLMIRMDCKILKLPVRHNKACLPATYLNYLTLTQPLDSDFKLESQVSAIVRSGFFHLRQLAKVKSLLAQQHFEAVIHAFITSRLDYCNALYFGVSQSSLVRLQLVQNAAARLLTGTRKTEHITPILASLHWLPVHFRVHFKILLFVFKSLNGLAPPYLSELLHPYAPARCLRSADQLLLEVPRSKRTLRGDRAFSVAAPKMWNDLPLHIRQASSLSVFKTNLKTHFYSLAFSPA